MNLYELNTKTMSLCRLELDDTDERSANAPLFLSSYNTAYDRIMRRKVMPEYTEAVTLDTEKCFSVSSLTYRCNYIIAITEFEDYTENAGYQASAKCLFYKRGSSTVIVPGKNAGDTVYVKYYTLPVHLSHKEVLFHAKALDTSTITIDEDITADMVDLLVDSKISVYSLTTGLYQTLTISAVTIGGDEDSSITVSEATIEAIAAGDIIYTNENTEYLVESVYNTPQFDESYHDCLCYYAAHEYYLRKGANYAELAMVYNNLFTEQFDRIPSETLGERQTFSNVYSPEL